MKFHSVSITAAVLVAFTLAAGSTYAEPVRMEITPFAGYRVAGDLNAGQGGEGGNPGNTEDGGGWGVSVGLYRDVEGFYEVLYSRRDAGMDAPDAALQGIDVRIEYLHFGGTLLFPQPQGFTSYFSATLGLTRFSARTGGYGSESEFSGSLGAGVRFPFTERLEATLGVRGYVTMVDRDTDLVCVSGDGEAGCLLRSSGRTVWEAEGQAGLTFRF